MMSKLLLSACFVLIFLTYGCKKKANELEKPLPAETAPKEQDIEKSMLAQGLVNIKDIDTTLMVNLKYATEDNFMHQNVYGSFTKAYLQPKAANMLKNAHKNLKNKHPNLRFLIYDAARPLTKQWELWNTLKVKPGEIKTDFVADPRKGSIHNYGCALDLTVFDIETNVPLDMGTSYDFFGELAYPKHEARLIAEGKLDSAQFKNRVLLRTAMQNAGFMRIESEWWHFNALSRENAKARYKIIQ